MEDEIQTVRCTRCGTENVFNSNCQGKLYCRECKKDLTKYVITKNDTKETKTALEQTILCPKCGSMIDINSLFCFACGFQVKSETPKCHNCGANVKINQKFCKKCGNKL